MPFHICHEEIMMFLAAFPFVGIAFHKAHMWYHAKFKCKHHG